jgi:hypothetical protein
MSVDPCIRELANVNREKQTEERGRLDERWDRMSSGDLSPEEEAELLALAESSEEGHEAYEAFRPLGPEFHASVAKTLRERGLVPEAEATVEKPAKLLSFPKRIFRPLAGWSSAAAAAAVLLLMIPRPPAPLPGYADVDVSGVSSFRGERPEEAVPTLVPGLGFEVTLSPLTAVSDSKRLDARCFLSQGRDLRRLEVKRNIDPSGSVKMTAMIDHDVRPGTWTLWAVVGRRDAMPDPDDLRRLLVKDQVRQRDWLAVPQKVKIQPRDLPP